MPESLPGMGLPYDALTTSEALQQAGRMFRESADRYHTPLSFNIHPPFFASYSGDFLRGSLELARKFDMPVLSAERWLDFLLAREGAKIVESSWNSNLLRFRVEQSIPELTWMFPAQLTSGAVFRQARVQGEPVTEELKTNIFGFDWILVKTDSPDFSVGFEIEYSDQGEETNR